MQGTKIPITIISLAKDEKRRRRIVQQCKTLGLNYKLFDAIDGNTLTQAELDKVYAEKNTISAIGRRLSRGEIGCALSHLSVYKQMLSENIKIMIILEDDAILSPKFKEALQIIDYLPKNWEILLLGYICYGNHFWYKLPIKIPKLKWRIAKAIGVCYCTHAYIIRQDTAKKILTRTKKLCQPIDSYTNDWRRIGVLLMMPKCVTGNVQFTDESNLHRERMQLSKTIYLAKYNIAMRFIIRPYNYLISTNTHYMPLKFYYAIRTFLKKILNLGKPQSKF